MKTILAFGFVTLTLTTLTTLPAQPAPPAPVQEFMRQKLEHSKHVLEGLAIVDFDLISKKRPQIADNECRGGLGVSCEPCQCVAHGPFPARG